MTASARRKTTRRLLKAKHYRKKIARLEGKIKQQRRRIRDMQWMALGAQRYIRYLKKKLKAYQF